MILLKLLFFFPTLAKNILTGPKTHSRRRIRPVTFNSNREDDVSKIHGKLMNMDVYPEAFKLNIQENNKVPSKQIYIQSALQ